MSGTFNADNGDSWVAGRHRTVNGEPFDPDNPEHRAVLEGIQGAPGDTPANLRDRLSAALRALRGRGRDARDDDDAEVTVITPPGAVAVTAQSASGLPARVRLTTRGEDGTTRDQHAEAGGTVHASSGDQVIVRRHRD